MKKAVLFALMAAASLAAQDFKVVQVKHRSAESLVRLVASGIPADFSREFNTITLRGPAESIKAAEAIIAQYDTPRRQAEFVIRVIEAGSAPQGPIDNNAADLVPAELKSLLRYSRYAQRDSAILRGMEGDELGIKLAGNLTASMRFLLREAQPAPLIDLRFRINSAAVVKREGQDVTINPTLLETSASLKSGETVVLGASKMQGGSSALIVLLTGKLLP